MSRIATVRVRITLAAVLVVGIALAAGGAWLVRAQRHSLTQNVETAARLRSRDIAATIADGDFPDVLAVPRGDENLVQVVDAQGASSPRRRTCGVGRAISTLRARVRAGPRPAARSRSPHGDGPFRVVARRVATSKGAYTVYVAGTLEGVDESTIEPDPPPRVRAAGTAPARGRDHLGGDRPRACARSRRCDARWRRSARRTSTVACPNPAPRTRSADWPAP